MLSKTPCPASSGKCTLGSIVGYGLKMPGSDLEKKRHHFISIGAREHGRSTAHHKRTVSTAGRAAGEETGTAGRRTHDQQRGETLPTEKKKKSPVTISAVPQPAMLPDGPTFRSCTQFIFAYIRPRRTRAGQVQQTCPVAQKRERAPGPGVSSLAPRGEETAANTREAIEGGEGVRERRNHLSSLHISGVEGKRPPIIRLLRARQRGASKAAGPRRRVKAGFPADAAVCGFPCRRDQQLWVTRQQQPCYLQRRRPRLRERWLGQERGRPCARTTAAAPAPMARPPQSPPPGLASTPAAPTAAGGGS